MALYDHVLIDESAGIATVRIHRPEARNAFTPQTIEELTEVARAYRRRADIAAVILTGSNGIFSAGMDLNLVQDGPRPSLVERRAAMQAGPDLAQAWEAIEAVTIAAIEGHCIGGSCALAIACDFRIIAEGGSMRLPEVPLGMSMPWRTIPRVASLIGASRAKQFILFGDRMDSARCVEWGLAEEVAPTGQAEACARSWAERVAALPPLPVRMTKDAVNAAVNANHHLSAFMDRDQYLLTALSEDYQEGVKAFREKRTPQFRGN
ncbi:MAG: enoyl-CoA hydratase/isomerase family protein [Sphingobium sp.]